MFRIAIVITALFALTACADTGDAYQQSSQDNAATMVILGTGFLNGYNGARQATTPVVSTSCTQLGNVSNCVGY